MEGRSNRFTIALLKQPETRRMNMFQEGGMNELWRKHVEQDVVCFGGSTNKLFI